MRDESLSRQTPDPEGSLRAERKDALRRRLKAGVFMALLSLGWAAQASTANAAPAGAKSGSLEERVQHVRSALNTAAENAAVQGMPVQPWFNIWWNNWSNGWNNGWNNWHNNWNNWSNAWNNWNNWKNAWYNV